MKKLTALLHVMFLGFGLEAFAMGFPESYYKIKNVKEQHETFGKILRPYIQTANEKILEERAFIEEFFNDALVRSLRGVDKVKLGRLVKLKRKYRVKGLYDRASYLKRIDIIPISLALAQGATESGWGKSRFVRLANNIFGHWTWGEKGIIPLRREEGKTHKIRIFDSLEGSVAAYALNLNRHYAYKDFRNKRAEAKEKGVIFGGLAAAETMLYYSEIREKYVAILKKSMLENNFLYYDNNPTQ